MRLKLQPFRVTHLVTPDTQGTPRGMRRIELADRTGGGVARVDEGGLVGGDTLLVIALEGRQRQVDFAAHLEHGGRLLARLQAQGRGNGVDGAQVGGDVLADFAVAAGGAAHQAAVFVDDRDGQPVDLGLDDEGGGFRFLAGFDGLQDRHRRAAC